MVPRLEDKDMRIELPLKVIVKKTGEMDPTQDGSYTITNCCAVAGLGGEPVYRDGSYEYYISEPVIENDPKSVGSFILAAIEYEKLNHK